jgi:predicted nucleic acid-binding Zn ribbon protein
MVDGVKCSCVGVDAIQWRNNPLLDFGLCVSESTGELRTGKREAKYRSMWFTLTPQRGGRLSCSITGSLHKYHNGNDTNFNAFTFDELFDTLDALSRDFGINLTTADIHGIEIGVNIPLDYTPQIILKNVICHKGKAFDSIDRKNKKLGLICVHTDYSIKLYDKGYQHKIAELDKYILRYEVKRHRQRMLEPYGISTLADLQNVEKVTALIILLAEKLNEIIFFDFSFKGKGLSEVKRLSWERYGNPNYWAGLSRNAYYKARKKYAELRTAYNCIDWGQFVLKHTTKTWFELSCIKQKIGRHFPQYFETLISGKEATFSKLEYVVEDVANGGIFESEEKKAMQSPNYCISCGRQITGQKEGSRFCSEKLYGKEAKRCRNKDSNRRLMLKRKITKAMEREKMLLITYKVGKMVYSDILSPSEIVITKQWLDRVMSVTEMERGITLNDEKAKESLTKYLIDNESKEYNH